MRVINTGNIYDIYDNSLKTFVDLPAQSYVVRCSENRGFFLAKYTDIEIKEEKIYGVHLSKIDKVLNAFEDFDRNLGVILSGNKGIGKSLFAKLLSQAAINKGIPLIVVDTFYPGIASYLESIEQEVVVLFDEFDKTFCEVSAAKGQASPQTGLLTLFDGVASGKKLFVITCNDIHKLNSFLVNRPGRFHYHFRFEYPSASEVREYLQDKISPEYYGEIDAVVAFSRKIDLNYDCLRAIAFELNRGLSFKEAIQDLNIINLNIAFKYNVFITFENGTRLMNKNCHLDLFRDEEQEIWFSSKENSSVVGIRFDALSLEFDTQKSFYFIRPELVTTVYSPYDEDKEVVAELEKTKIKSIAIVRQAEKNIHYMV